MMSGRGGHEMCDDIVGEWPSWLVVYLTPCGTSVKIVWKMDALMDDMYVAAERWWTEHRTIWWRSSLREKDKLQYNY